jgi:hypothetical protein
MLGRLAIRYFLSIRRSALHAFACGRNLPVHVALTLTVDPFAFLPFRGVALAKGIEHTEDTNDRQFA